MKTISVTDLKLIPELSHLRPLEFIDPVNDALIAPFLKVLGFDLDYAVEYVPCQHRNLQNEVVISYVIRGEVECNASFLESSFATIEDRMIAAGYKDLGEADFIANQMTSSRDYGDAPEEAFPPELVNPDEDKILAEIETLKELLFLARGNPYKNDGSRKTLAEQHIVELPEKQRRKSAK